MEAARTLHGRDGVGLQIPAAKWNTSADDWFVGETFQFIKYNATAGHTDPVGPLTDDDGKTASLTPARPDQPVSASAATTSCEGLGVGDDLEALARHEPVAVAAVQVVVGVEAVEVHDDAVRARARRRSAARG